MTRLDGKVALITGGGSGIGEQIARLFAARGARVAIAGRRPDRLATVAKDTGALPIVTDVTQEPQVTAMVKACLDAFGRLDILVNNAGISGPIMDAEDMDVAAWDAMMAINVRGAMLVLKHGIPPLIKTRGVILQMSSRMAFVGTPQRSAYCASKFALNGITDSIVHELGPKGVRVVSVCPGAVNGELMERVIDKRVRLEGRPREAIIEEAYTSKSALRKWVDPEEIAAMVLYLVSDEAAAITGAHVKIDAGRF